MRYTRYCFAGSVVVMAAFALSVGSAYADQMLRVGNMWDEIGNHERAGWGGNAFRFPGGFWPSSINGVNSTKSGASYHGHSMGARNFTTAEGQTLDYAFAQATTKWGGNGGYDWLDTGGTRLVWQQQPPMVIVDGVVLQGEAVDEVDPSLVSDAMIEVVWRNFLGITTTLQAHAYVNHDFDEVIIRHYNFLNNGDAGADTGPLTAAVNGFLFLVDVWFMDRAEGGGHWGHAAEWAGDAYIQYYGGLRDVNLYEEWVDSGGASGDSLRIMYAWDGDSKLNDLDDAYDPHQDTGRLLSAKFPGVALLHADLSANDASDWAKQPVAMIVDYWNELPERRREGEEVMYRHAFGDQNPDQSIDNPFYTPSRWQLFEEGVLAEPDPNPTDPELFGAVGELAMGPYDIPSGEDIDVILAYGIGGMDYQRTILVGSQYKSGLITQAEKDAIAGAYKDTLFRNIGLARQAVSSPNGRFDIPDPPPAPDLTITSGAGQIRVEWSDVSNSSDRDTGAMDFMEYRLYRAQGSYFGDMPFERIFNGTTTSYTDTDVIRGFSYYYYVTAVDDGTQNWVFPGRPVESGMHHNRSTKPAVPFRTPFQPGKDRLGEGDVRVVPNPWDAGDVFNKYGPEGTDDFRKIRFINLPPVCTIKIYTEAGDLVRTIEHGGTASLPSGDEDWDQITDFNQEVVSGVYVAVIDSDTGADVVKFVIVK